MPGAEMPCRNVEERASAPRKASQSMWASAPVISLVAVNSAGKKIPAPMEKSRLVSGHRFSDAVAAAENLRLQAQRVRFLCMT
jgi:hypothetical protein